MKARPRRSRPAPEPPEGLRYISRFVSSADEVRLLEQIEALTFQEVRMKGVVARRTVIHYGWDYDYEGWKILPAAPPPPFVEATIGAAAAAAGVPRESIEQVMIARDPPGAAFGWHPDAPMFGSPVIGVSLGAACLMHFRRKTETGFEVYKKLLEPGSLYVLDGPARSVWQHSIPRTPELRYSVTMRTLRQRGPRAPGPPESSR